MSPDETIDLGNNLGVTMQGTLVWGVGSSSQAALDAANLTIAQTAALVAAAGYLIYLASEGCSWGVVGGVAAEFLMGNFASAGMIGGCMYQGYRNLHSGGGDECPTCY